jgi:hypothetical protein
MSCKGCNSIATIPFQLLCNSPIVATPLLEECEDETHTPEMRTWESTETPGSSEFDCRGQDTSH